MDKLKGLIIIGNRSHMYRIIALLALLWAAIIGGIWLIWRVV
jgi:hypothetical protein